MAQSIIMSMVLGMMHFWFYRKVLFFIGMVQSIFVNGSVDGSVDGECEVHWDGAEALLLVIVFAIGMVQSILINGSVNGERDASWDDTVVVLLECVFVAVVDFVIGNSCLFSRIELHK
jgi:hypothetical protein